MLCGLQSLNTQRTGGGAFIGVRQLPLRLDHWCKNRTVQQPNRRLARNRVHHRTHLLTTMASSAEIPPQEELDSYLSVALAAAREAGKAIVAAWDAARNIEHKGERQIYVCIKLLGTMMEILSTSLPPFQLLFVTFLTFHRPLLFRCNGPSDRD